MEAIIVIWEGEPQFVVLTPDVAAAKRAIDAAVTELDKIRGLEWDFGDVSQFLTDKGICCIELTEYAPQ